MFNQVGQYPENLFMFT